MGAALHLTINFTVCECFRCGVPIAIPNNRYRVLVEEGSDFWCVNGHSQRFIESETTRLKKQLEEKERALAFEKNRRESAEKQVDETCRKLSAAKGQVTKIKNRVGNGVCPCCNRTFQNLMKHMHTQHPEYKEP